jgi:uncharacterized protein (TIGR03663 family)
MSALPQQRHEYATPGVLGRTIDLTRLNLEVLAFVAIVALSVIAHLYGLGRMALHHDESIHAWMSWKFFTGSGGFTCFGGRTANTYCYEPTYHGPSLYIFTLVSYFLFGDGDWQARLPQALAGIGMVASVWMLRPYLGTRGMLVAAVLLSFAPSLLYYTRFARHDGLILLWTLWMVIGFFRYLDSGRAGFLVLMAAGIALAIATHELYYLLFFIFGWFVIIRFAYERLPLRLLNIILLAVVALAFVLELWNPRITTTLRAAGMANLLISVALGGFLMVRVWEQQPILTNRAVWLWRSQRGALWAALAVLGAIYVVMYSTFFADPQSLLNGLYAGLAYWLGSQQEAARGDQPWYYHLMLLSIYEPLTLFGGIGAVIYLYTRNLKLSAGRRQPARAATPAVKSVPREAPADNDQIDVAAIERAEEVEREIEIDATAEPEPIVEPRPTVPLFPLFLAFWFIGAFVSFSWAGEKMPWLVTHISLPGNLLIAWALGQMIEAVNWRDLARQRLVLVPPFLVLTIVALGVAYWRFSTPASDQQGQSTLLQGLVPLIVGGGMLYALLTIGQRAGWRTTAALCGLTISAMLGFAMVRATWMVVYDHPDTPVEPLVYVQSSPDVPLIVRNIRELAINQTRNIRNENDPVGGLTMPVIMDAGDPAVGGEGSLAWPYQWYFRDFKRLESRNSDFFRTATPDSFIVEPVQPGADRELAPVIIASKGSINEVARGALEENYVKRFDSKLNWWFPEGFKCDPQTAGYKRFYYSNWMTADALKDCPSLDPTQLSPIYAPLLWPLDGSHWGNTWKYLVYRELPEPLRLDGREMEMWVRRDLAPVGGQQGGTSAGGPLKLVAQQAIGAPGSEPGQLGNPSGAAVDAQGNLYVADTNNHRIQVFAPDGTPLRTIGSFGVGPAQFNEPRGVAVDAQGMIYVADTWNARIVKLDPQGNQVASWGSGTEDFGNGRVASPTDGTLAGNAAAPLSLFGPRGIAVDDQGNVYIADTGNKRIVVTDSDGNFRLQWGEFGSAPGQFSEPTSVAVDGANIYVADTWNGRVQLFVRDEEGQVSPAPASTWRVAGWQAQTYDDPAIAASGGQVAVSIPGRNLIMLTDATGQELLRWGGSGTDLASLRLPSGLAFTPDQGLVVVDRGNGRLLQYKLP